MAVTALVAAILLQVVATALLGLSLDAFGGLLLVLVGAALATGSAMWWLRSRPQDVPAGAARAELRPVLLRLNCWTAVSLLAFFLGVVAHSAGVLFTLEVAVAPPAVTIGTARRAGSQGITGPGTAQWVGAVTLILIGAVTVALIEVDGTSATGLVVSIALGLLAGGSVGAIVMLSERLGSSGAGVAYVIANRFHLTYLLADTPRRGNFSGQATIGDAGVFATPTAATRRLNLHIPVLGGGGLDRAVVSVEIGLRRFPDRDR